MPRPLCKRRSSRSGSAAAQTVTTTRGAAISCNICSWVAPITRRYTISSSAPVSSQGICTTQVGACVARGAISS